MFSSRTLLIAASPHGRVTTDRVPAPLLLYPNCHRIAYQRLRNQVHRNLARRGIRHPCVDLPETRVLGDRTAEEHFGRGLVEIHLHGRAIGRIQRPETCGEDLEDRSVRRRVRIVVGDGVLIEDPRPVATGRLRPSRRCPWPAGVMVRPPAGNLRALRAHRDRRRPRAHRSRHYKVDL